MNFQPSEDRRMLADSLNRFLSEQYGIEARNRAAYGEKDGGGEGFSRQTWQQLAEIGAIGALFSEDSGGFGGDGFDIATVFECVGRGLAPEPLLGALMVGKAIEKAGTPAQKERIASLVDGSAIAALAHDETGSHYEPHLVRLKAERQAGGWLLNGSKSVVAFGAQADILLVSARTGGAEDGADGISLFLVPADAPGLKRRSTVRIDGGQVAELAFDGVQLPEDALLGSEGQGAAILEHATGCGVLALCAEALGLMDIIKQQTLEYLQTRKQFGRPIGSFQALQHRMAVVLLEVEQARSAVTNAAAALDRDQRLPRERALSAAKYSIGRIGQLVAEESIQLHGGIGMTWELPLSHYAKRLVMIDHQLGDEDHHLARYIALGHEAA